MIPEGKCPYCNEEHHMPGLACPEMVIIQNSEHDKMRNKEVARLAAQNAKLVEALKWYADDENWVIKERDRGPNSPPAIMAERALADAGQKARAALERADDVD